jgi:SAM-dependent methyltransferase
MSRSSRTSVETLSAVLEERLALMAPARRLRLALADRIVTGYAGERPIAVLDAGAGDGLLSLALAKRHPTWDLLGVDLRERLLDGARARAQGRSLDNVRFQAADLTRPLPESGFDVVLALEILSEIPDDEAALKSMAAALAPDGLLVVQVPVHDWKPVLPGSAPTWRHQVRQGYSPDGLVAALRRTGLDRISVRPTYHATVVLAQEARDRIKSAPTAVRAGAFPLMASAVRLERWGMTAGQPRALIATARRPGGD